MRQVFTSRRVENVEAVARMLREAGIEVHVTAERSYRGNRRGNFSYRERDDLDAAPMPAVWVVHANDHPAARELLRQANLLESTRTGDGISYLPRADGRAERKTGFTPRLRMLLLGAIVIGMGLVWLVNRKLHQAAPPPVVAAPAKPAPVVVVVDDIREPYPMPVPGALAALLVRDAAFDGPAPCVQVNDAPPRDTVRAALPAGAIADAARCGEQVDLRIGPYLTDGTGRGSVRVQVFNQPARTLHVERQGTAWRILARD